MADKVTVKDQYMGTGNAPKSDGEGEFPVLELSTGGRYVGRIGQSFDDLRKEAVDNGFLDKDD